jgi:hypothetical protein
MPCRARESFLLILKYCSEWRISSSRYVFPALRQFPRTGQMFQNRTGETKRQCTANPLNPIPP